MLITTFLIAQTKSKIKYMLFDQPISHRLLNKLADVSNFSIDAKGFTNSSSCIYDCKSDSVSRSDLTVETAVPTIFFVAKVKLYLCWKSKVVVRWQRDWLEQVLDWLEILCLFILHFLELVTDIL